MTNQHPEKDIKIPLPPVDPIIDRARKEKLRRKKVVIAWRHPEYQNNRLIISWEIPAFIDNVSMAGAELICTVVLPKGMNLYEYEHWNCTEEGHTYMKARFPMCESIAAKIDTEKEEANAQNSNNNPNE